MAAEVKSSAPVSAAERKEEGSPFAETMPADSNFLATQTPKRLQAMERQLELERDVKAELQVLMISQTRHWSKVSETSFATAVLLCDITGPTEGGGAIPSKDRSGA